MATAYTSLLGLALPVQGELQGTWGDTVNNSITSLLDTAVAGTTTLSTDADVTLSTTTGASNQARQAIILWTANGTTTRNITAPAQSKIYTVINKTAGTQSIVLRGVGPTTGVTIPAGASGTFAWNGVDFVDVSNYVNGNKIINGNLTVNGTTTLKGNTTVGDATADTLTVTSTITSNLIFTDNTYDIGASGATRPRNLFLAGNSTIGGNETVTGAITVDSTTDSSSTTTGSIQTDGGLGVAKALYVGTTANIAGAVTLSGGTANGVAYLNGSKVLTTGSALTFDGTNFATTGSVTSAGASNSLNLTFTGTGNRITGDFSNATIANRVAFQTSTVNGATQIAAIPNGTSNTATLQIYNTNDPANSSRGIFGTVGTTEIRLTSDITGTGTYLPMTFYTGGSERMRIDTSGNVGIGTSSPSYGLDIRKSTGGISWSTDPQWWVKRDSGAEFLVQPTSSLALVGTFSNHSVAITTNNTERMRIDSSGNVGIGTSNTPSNKDTVTPKLIVNGSGVAGSMQVVRNTTPGSGGAILELTATRGSDVNSYTILQSGDGVGSVVFGGADGNEFVVAGSIQCQVDGTPGDNDMPGRLVFNTTADGASNTTERMRIDSSGNLLVGTTSAVNKLYVKATTTAVVNTYLEHTAASPYGLQIYYSGAAPNNTDNEFIYCSDTSNNRFIVYSSGNVANRNNSYGGISDIKLKENIVDATPKLEKLNQVRVVNYNMIGETKKQIGVIAQELEQIFPGMVEESLDKDKDGNHLGTTTKQVKYSVFVPMLIKAIQEQQALIQTLTARIEALETKGA